MKFSIYIVNRNYSRFINYAIKSVYEQTLKVHELIIIDDFSNDDSKNIIKKLKAKYNFKTIFNKKKLGLIKSSNIAIKKLTGDYFLRLDADDLLDKNAIKNFSNFLKLKKSSLVYGNYTKFSHNKKIYVKRLSNDNEKYIDFNQILGACCLIKLEDFKRINYYDESFDRQDGLTLYLKLSQNFEINFINKNIFFYRMHKKNLTKKTEILKNTRLKILSKFLNMKKKISCILPIGNNVNIFKNKFLIKNINMILKIKDIDNIIVTTHKKKMNQFKKKFGTRKKISYHLRGYNKTNIENKFHFQLKNILQKIKNIQENFLVLITDKYLIKKKLLSETIYVHLLNNSDFTFSSKEFLNLNLYKYEKHGLKEIIKNNSEEIIDRNKILVKPKGGIYIYNLNNFSKKNKKISNTLI